MAEPTYEIWETSKHADWPLPEYPYEVVRITEGGSKGLAVFKDHEHAQMFKRGLELSVERE